MSHNYFSGNNFYPKIPFVMEKESAIKEIKGVLDKHNPVREGFLKDDTAFHFVWSQPIYSTVTLYFRKKTLSSCVMCKSTVPKAIVEELRAMAGAEALKGSEKREGPRYSRANLVQVDRQPFDKKPVKGVRVETTYESYPFVQERQRAIHNVRAILDKYGDYEESEPENQSSLKFSGIAPSNYNVVLYFRKKIQSSRLLCRDTPNVILRDMRNLAGVTESA
jgi:hypothetical protein